MFKKSENAELTCAVFGKAKFLALSTVGRYRGDSRYIYTANFQLGTLVACRSWFNREQALFRT